jgi:hypothetical protein
VSEDYPNCGSTMPRAGDTSEEDFDDGPRGPEPTADQRARSHASRKAVKATMAVGLIFGAFLLFGIGANLMVPRSREATYRMYSAFNLQQIGLAIRNYNDAEGQLPHNTYGPDGTPLLSWRVHILPYIEYDQLYRQFDLNEPWDGPNNIRLINRMPPAYDRTNGPRSGGYTVYRGFSSPGAVFELRPAHIGRPRNPDRGLDLASIKDGPENTILVVEAGEPIEWTKPDDLDASPGKPFPKMGGLGWRKVFQALTADGAVHTLPLNTPEDVLRALVTHSGGEPLPPDWDR